MSTITASIFSSKTGKSSQNLETNMTAHNHTVWPTHYQTRHFFNISNINEDIAMKFEQEYVRCVRNEKERVCSVCL